MEKVVNPKVLEEAKLALKILRNIFVSAEIGDEKVIVFASIVKNQSLKLEIDWKKLLKQYEELGSEMYTNQKTDFFKRTRKYIESGRKIV